MVFAFSFTKKELQTQTLTLLRERFEQLDVKLITEYRKETTHVVSRKRNTAKGLQGLINGKFIVNETFLDAITQAAAASDDSQVPQPSLLEQDYDRNWPDAAQHLPPPGGEPVVHPNSAYQPDPARKDVFEGYTFIFYDKSQYDTLLAPVTAGGGKALLGDVVPEQTEVDEFVRYVKSVAGEKGLGAFDDGSEGRGVVLVRYLPSKGVLIQWYTGFITAVSLSLDHRPIEQSEFLEAILSKDASILRRALEVESQQNTQEPQRTSRATRAHPEASNPEAQSTTSQPIEQSQPAPRTARTRRPMRRRFAGFDDDADVDMDDVPPASAPDNGSPPADEGGLFVSQDPDAPVPEQNSSATRRSQRKRPASPVPEDDLMSGMAPSAARFKRQRIERGEDVSASNPEPEESSQTAQISPPKKIKKEIDILAVAAQNREEEEARARAEKEDLANLPDDVDLSEIRRLNIVEEMEVRAPAQSRTREQDVATGRWDPKWNGIKNFKKFRRRGQVTGRQPARVIVPLTEVKSKEYGVGDDYWLEDEDTQRKKKTVSQPSGRESQPSAPAPSSSRTNQRRVVVSEDSDEEEEEETPILSSSRTRNARAAATPSQSNTRTQSSRTTSQGSKRAAAAEPAKEQPTKRARSTRKVFEVADSDDSDDELKFRFGKRR